MKERTTVKPTHEGEESLQLLRESMGLVIHDLGSIAGALSMRAALPVPADAAANGRHQAVLMELSRQVRVAMQRLELARWQPAARPDGQAHRAGASTTRLAPVITAEAWIRQVVELARSVFPRGLVFSIDEASVSSSLGERPLADAAVLIRLVHAAWHGLLESPSAETMPATVELAGNGSALAMTARNVTDWSPSAADHWRDFSTKTASAGGYQVHWWQADATSATARTEVRWMCVPAPAVG